ncbi:MAG: Crp/Fnr family transcriptional regulator [Gammaproteobacteria bacterium]|nr:Crp/Fnr family transcriptional regulator [Gammaproteobacteria bacterium]MDH5653301.1 Crp/Fnr family transcriptional regulator [Gammaproteobacteria bacterium]
MELQHTRSTHDSHYALFFQHWNALSSIANRLHLGRNDFVFHANSPGKNVYALLEGRIKLFRVSHSGRELIQWFCFPGEVFGFAEIPHNGERGIYAQCCSDAVVLSIPERDFRHFIDTHPTFAIMVIEQLTLRLRTVGDMLLNLTSDDAGMRIKKLLVRLCARFGHWQGDIIVLDVSLTHQELADMSGTCRQTVTSVLNTLKRKGILQIERQRILILQPALFDESVEATPYKAFHDKMKSMG